MASVFPTPSPTFPDFSTLLVKGNYHASAPIHLALSYARANDAAKVLLLAPSRVRLTEEVKQVKDGYLDEQGGSGKVARPARRVDMLYPPTPAHLALIFSLLHEALSTGKDFLHPKTTFSVAPSLIVLCEPSSYFREVPDATYECST
ncbi:hypothetical protein BC835DRAFT_1275765 [Cytidiella melzeri]|nr:hypothetical protein BC835DRAFT_1275765 [Cytidiella melzeri]